MHDTAAGTKGWGLGAPCRTGTVAGSEVGRIAAGMSKRWFIDVHI